MSSCNDVSINNLVVLLKNVLNQIQIIGPILCIISLIVIFIKIINTPNEKKYDKYIKNITISLLVLFFIPMSINVLMNILGDNNTFTSCWNNNNEFIDSNTKYINIEEKDKNSLLVNPNSYEKGIKKSDIATLAVYLAPYASPDETTVYAPKNYSEPSVNAKCGTSNNPNPWYPPSQVDKNYTNFEKVMNAVINDERPGNRAYGSCAQASGAIIRATVDPDFETGNPALQIKYLDSNKDKWKLVKILKPGDNLDKECEPGDLLVTNSEWEHTMIYVGNKAVKHKFKNSNGNIFQAGYDDCDHAKYPRIDYIGETPVSFRVYRPTGKGSFKYSFVDVNKILK